MTPQQKLIILVIVLLVFVHLYMKKREKFRIITGLGPEDYPQQKFY